MHTASVVAALTMHAGTVSAVAPGHGHGATSILLDTLPHSDLPAWSTQSSWSSQPLLLEAEQLVVDGQLVGDGVPALGVASHLLQQLPDLTQPGVDVIINNTDLQNRHRHS